ncbi:MAG: hypothetical protein ACJAYG_000875 [Oceanicoccus sp.]|jgi:hypothetical protein
MPDTSILFYIAAELAVLLLVICIFLLIHLGQMRKLMARLEEKILELRQMVGSSRKESKHALKKLALAEAAAANSRAFIDYLDDEIYHTRRHHQSLSPDRDIVLDIATDAPLDRQAAALRHVFLIAEKEARYAGSEDESSWAVLQSKLQQIIQFYESAAVATTDNGAEAGEVSTDDDATARELENLNKRLENLERFKSLFFNMESQWEQAKKQSDDYYQQLLALTEGVDPSNEFEKVLKNYASAYDDLGATIAEGVDGESPTLVAKEVPAQPTNGKSMVANQDEIERLKNMAVNQHKVITELKKKLVGASSVEEQQQVVEELSQQLEQQQRFLQEAETCTQLIEDELSRVIQENDLLRAQSGGSEETFNDEHIEPVVNELTKESKDMLATIDSLEDENTSLKRQLESSGGNDANTELLKSKLEEIQQERLNLQTQHIELEERYLELKMK